MRVRLTHTTCRLHRSTMHDRNRENLVLPKISFGVSFSMSDNNSKAFAAIIRTYKAAVCTFERVRQEHQNHQRIRSLLLVVNGSVHYQRFFFVCLFLPRQPRRPNATAPSHARKRPESRVRRQVCYRSRSTAPGRRSVPARNDPRGPSGTQVRPFSADAAASTPFRVHALCMIAGFRHSDHVFVKEESFSQTPEATAMSRCGGNATAGDLSFETRTTRRRVKLSILDRLRLKAA